MNELLSQAINDYCLVKTRSSITKLLLREILFVEQVGRKIIFHTIDSGEMAMYEKLNYVMPYINGSFIYTNRAVFNSSYIKVVTAGGLIHFFNGERYQLSARDCGEFRRNYARLLQK